jgi:hypothetical protein
MATTGAADPIAQQRRLMHIATDLAVVVLLFGTLMSSWVTVIVSGTVLIGLLLYVWFVVRDPDRHKFAFLAIGAALAAAAVAAGVALLK